MALDLYALILQLHPTERTTLPAMVGEQAHAAFLATIHAAEPALAAWLHAEHGAVKPFGVALMAPWSALQARRWTVQPGDTLRLRVTLVGRPLYEQFMTTFLRGNYQLRIGPAQFTTGRIIVSGQGEALSGHATTEQLWAEARPQPSQWLRFAMPTTWRAGMGTQRYFALWPEPRPLYQKLSQMWHQWAEPSAHFDYRALLNALDEGAVLPISHHLRTVHWQANKPPTQGFIGWVRYEVNSTEEVQRWVDLLSRFAFFTSVGNSGGRGLGVVLPDRLHGATTDASA